MVEGGLEESFLVSFLNLKRPLHIILEGKEQWTGVGRRSNQALRCQYCDERPLSVRPLYPPLPLLLSCGLVI